MTSWNVQNFAVKPLARGFVLPTMDPFLERPGNLTGPELDFDIKVSRKVGRVLTSDEVHFVSWADNFTVQFSNLLKLPLEWKTKQLNGPGNYRELRETGPWSNIWYPIYELSEGHSCPEHDLWMAFVDGVIDNNETVASSKKHTQFTIHIVLTQCLRATLYAYSSLMMIYFLPKYNS